MSKKNNNGNDIVLSYHDSLLRNSDVDLLRGPYWLNDTIIGFYFEYLNNKDGNSAHDVLLYVSPELTQLLKLTAPSDYEILLESIDLKAKSFVFFPLNNCDSRDSAGGSHWSLLVYSKPEKMCFHFDSSKGFNSAIAKHFARSITEYFCAERFENYVEIDIPQQNNGYDCGLYVLCCTDLITGHIVLQQTIKDCKFKSLKLLVDDKRIELLKLIDHLKNVNTKADK